MARLLILARGNGPFRQDDVLHAIEDGLAWGSRETFPTFYQVDLPGLSVAAALAWKDGVTLSEDQIVQIRLAGRVVFARRYAIALDTIERRSGARHVRQTGELTRQWSEVMADAIIDRDQVFDLAVPG